MKKLITIALIALSFLQIAVAQKYDSPLRTWGYDADNKLYGAIKSIEEKCTYYELVNDALVVKNRKYVYGKAIWQFDTLQQVTGKLLYNENDSLAEWCTYKYTKKQLIFETQLLEYYDKDRVYTGNHFEKKYYFYDTLGVLKSSSKYQCKGKDTVFYDPFTRFYHYTPEKLLAFIDHSGTGGRVVYTYDTNHNLIREINYSAKDHQVISYSIDYKYDAKNRLIDKTQRDDTEINTIYQYTYYKNNTLKTKRYYACKRYGNRDLICHLKYNKNGNCLKIINKQTLPKVKTVTYNYTYEYDTHNNWTKRTEFEDDKEVNIVTRNMNYYQ